MKARNKLYRIEEFNTTGWEVIDQKHDLRLSKSIAKERLEAYMADGYSPERLRAVLDEDGKYTV